MLVCEYLPGEELTVDCVSDRERGLLYVGPRRRERVRAGISMDSFPIDDPDVQVMAERIAETLELWGAWFFQVRRAADGEWVLLEVGGRIGGTMAVSRARGANLPWLAILEAERADFGVLVGDYEVRIDRALLNRFQLGIEYSAVYVDLDDTLIVDDAVNVEVVRFCYQAINAGKRVVVITRHDGDPHETLARFRLGSMADEVVHLDRSASKADAIVESDAILIDDSFGERADVYHRLGIPVFDANMVEALIDDRA
jgi:carbamoyl-phosphate synthase large subunit